MEPAQQHPAKVECSMPRLAVLSVFSEYCGKTSSVSDLETGLGTGLSTGLGTGFEETHGPDLASALRYRLPSHILSRGEANPFPPSVHSYSNDPGNCHLGSCEVEC